MSTPSTPAGGFDEAPLPRFDLIVFCHLRWDFVYQRPQHIISRLAKSHRVLFVEEPLRRHDTPRHHLRQEADGLWVLQPNVDHIAEIAAVLEGYLPQSSVPVGWFYSPSFVALLDHFTFHTVVYDCMDELSLFRGAPPELIEQERQLLEQADIVFTGGPSLYTSKQSRHDSVFCFPSSVDREHFSRALDEGPVPADIQGIEAPIVGYFGVIDERIDLPLLAATAERTPEANFVMIGPLAKIGYEDLPQRSNIHYLGMKNYAELPDYLRSFTVAMMPFALNDATRFISPTKTLEYMAAGKPIVSTAIRDVVDPYGDVVSIVDSPDSFSAAVRTAIAQRGSVNYNKILQATSWDATVQEMQSLLAQSVISYG